MSTTALNRLTPSFDGGFKIEAVKNKTGQKIDYFINKTMMRISLPVALQLNKTRLSQ